MCEAYNAYFGMPVMESRQTLGTSFYLQALQKTLEGWPRGEKRAMKFAIPRIWREPIDHSSNYYFCTKNPSKHRAGKNTSAIMSPDLPSSIAPVPHCPELPVPTPPERKQPSSEESSKSEEKVDIEDPDYNIRGAAGEILV
ncbi:uncharacterized protein LOC143223010 [Tachypleus tridentatus]|uniref:uncharacterized protein LOC143223010 n=1 Tax=Tachypleus tridentatus TaxID=6853 RepID=UPI003FCF7365